MKRNSRTAFSVLNIVSGFGNRLITSLLKLLGRVVFLRHISAELYGVSGLFSGVLGLLALAELGVGTAITFSLYKPLAEKDDEKIASLMAFYRKAYCAIAGVVGVLGLALMPFLPHLIRNYQGIDYFYLIYLVFLFNLVVEYLFSYKRTLAQAAQEGFRLVPFTTLFEGLICLLQIATVLLFYKDPRCFLYYLGVQSLCIVVQNVVINRYLDRRYPILKRKTAPPLPKEEKRALFVNVRALMYHKVGSVAVSGTDNLLISLLVDLVTVGLYSNYSTMVMTVSGIVYLFVGNTTASFGNLIVKESPQKRLAVFRELQFFYFALYGICTAFFLTLFQPFISLAYGEAYLISMPVVALVVVANFYLLGLTYVMDVIKSAAGLYDRDKWVPLVQAGLNLLVSIVLGHRIGLAGIFVGTLISTLVPLIAKPIIVYKAVFEASAREYFLSLGYQLLVCAVLCGASMAVTGLVGFSSPLIQLLFNLVATSVVAVGLFLLMNLRSPQLPALFRRVRSLLKKAP